MSVDPKLVQKVLSSKIMQLNNIIADIDGLLTKMETNFFRVSIFGSARMKPDTPMYRTVCELAYELALRNCDIVTGGGPGLMEASNKGAKMVEGHRSRSIGLSIQLHAFEGSPNAHLDVKREHRRFSSRLDEFMRISHAVIVTPGGIGTILELFYTWQLLQVHHIEPRPIIFLGEMWPELMDWMKKWPLEEKLMSESDFQSVTLCQTVEEVIRALEPAMLAFQARKTGGFPVK